MSYTKGDLVREALDEIGIADYEFDVSAEQKQATLHRLDMLMSTWSGRGIKLSYSIPSGPNGSELEEESNIPNWANEAVITNLALKIAPSYGKAVNPDTRITAKNSYDTVLLRFANPREMQFPTMPKGAGFKESDYRFSNPPEERNLDYVDEDIDTSGGPTNEP